MMSEFGKTLYYFISHLAPLEAEPALPPNPRYQVQPGNEN